MYACSSSVLLASCAPEQPPVCCDAQHLHPLHLLENHVAISSCLRRSRIIVQRLMHASKRHTQLQRT